jgi:hypothetical protein
MSNVSKLLGALVRDGIQVILLSGGNGADTIDGADYEDPIADVAPPPMVPPPFPGGVDPSGDAEELQKLRAQVQSLTAELQTAREQVPAAAGEAPEQPTGLGGAMDDASIDVLGIEDDKLVRKLARLGYDTISKLRDALMSGSLAEAKIKKDWLIDVGMALAGAAPSHAPAAGVAAAPVAVGGAPDVPEGHQDRAWLERLAVAKQKQDALDELNTTLAAKQAEVEAISKKNQEVPEELDEDIITLEESIETTKAHLVSLRWCMNLNPDVEKSLDEALQEANLGPWMGTPQPRVMQGAGA